MSTGRPDSPWLVADIGGTNARFAIAPEAGADPGQQQVLPCADFPDLAAAAAHYLEGITGPRPRHAAMAIATSITGDQVRMTNNPWAFSIDEARRQLGLERLELINDFTAQALAIPHLEPASLRPLGAGAGAVDTPLAVVGPGTGLGVSGLIPAGDDWIALKAAGGHVSFSPVNAREIALLEVMLREFEHVSAERLISGMGLENIYRGLCQLDGVGARALRAPAIVEQARAGQCELSLEAVRMLTGMLGTVTGNVVLTLGARGGFYICGGVVLRLGELFDEQLFRERFEAHGRFRGYLSAVPGYLVLEEQSALLGMARGYTLRCARG